MQFTAISEQYRPLYEISSYPMAISMFLMNMQG
jgi:hypothetical protein